MLLLLMIKSFLSYHMWNLINILYTSCLVYNKT